MDSSETLSERLIRHEGLLLKPYRDTLGKLTIGVGRCLDTHGISRDEAMLLLQNDLNAAAAGVAAALPWTAPLDRARLEVLYEMAFQLGLCGLLAFKKMLAALQSGDYAAAAQAMLASDWHAQSRQRCEELASLMYQS
jgi:lysozyme